MTKRKIIIATRESPLALQQAELVKLLLTQLHPHLTIEFLGITTEADKTLDVSLTTIGGKGLFVKELEDALLNGRADIAVHSMKDMPMDLPEGLCIPVMLKREDPRDVFVANDYNNLAALPTGARLGTSSLRRQTQLLALRNDLTLCDLRGNVNTRLRRLDEGRFDALILAAAGLKRLHLTARIREYLSLSAVLPAPGQGALGIECNANDSAILQLILPLNDAITQLSVEAERALCRRLGGGCQTPIAAFAHIHNGLLTLEGLVANRDGTRILRSKVTGDPKHFQAIGTRAAVELIDQGAEKILREFYAP